MPPLPLPRLLAVLLLVCLPLCSARADSAEVGGARVVSWLLTWREDPTTTQVIDWHQDGPAAATPLAFAWRAVGAAEWRERAPDVSRAFAFSPRWLHRVELRDLAPDTLHEFRVGAGEPLRFRTLPARLERPLLFAAGGDIYGDAKICARLDAFVAARDAAFVLWGGDLAYDNAEPKNVGRVHRFLEIAAENLLAPGRRVLPVVAAIGNHEVAGGAFDKAEGGRAAWPGTDAAREAIAPHFYTLFAFPGHPGRGVLDLGDYASLVLLDTDHTGPMEGAQTDWLAATLRARGRVSHVFPVYHVPAYPSVRAFDGRTPAKLRELWTPLFDEAGVRLAFENHDHGYKRTVPLRAGAPDPSGVTYAGDGAWGVAPRPVDATRPYLARAESRNHAMLVTLHPDRAEVEAVSPGGEVFDRFTVPARAVPPSP